MGKSMLIGLICIAAFGAGCGRGATPSAFGTVTGIAEPCVGPPVSQSVLRSMPVTVTLSHNAHIVARQTIRGPHVFRFTAGAGAYVVSTVEGDGSNSEDVKLTNGKTIHAATIPSNCM